MERNQAHRSAEFEYGGEAILMETCVETSVDLLDNRMTVSPWGCGRMGERCGRGGSGHSWSVQEPKG